MVRLGKVRIFLNYEISGARSSLLVLRRAVRAAAAPAAELRRTQQWLPIHAFYQLTIAEVFWKIRRFDLDLIEISRKWQ